MEGYSYGVPAVMSSSIDAFVDLYDENCCIGADNYEIDTFASCMQNALSREWNRGKIKKKADEFTEALCAQGYLKALRIAAEHGHAPFDIKTLELFVNNSLGKNKE